MTDYDPELEALLTRQADEVREFLDRALASDALRLASLGRQVIAAMGLDMDDVIAALGLSGTAVNVSKTSGGFGGSGIFGGTAVNVSKTSGGAVTGTGSLALGKQGIVAAGDIGEVAGKAVRDGIMGWTYNQLYILALIVVIATTLGVILPDLTMRNMAELGVEVAVFDAARGLADKAAKRKK